MQEPDFRSLKTVFRTVFPEGTSEVPSAKPGSPPPVAVHDTVAPSFFPPPSAPRANPPTRTALRRRAPVLRRVSAAGPEANRIRGKESIPLCGRNRHRGRLRILRIPIVRPPYRGPMTPKCTSARTIPSSSTEEVTQSAAARASSQALPIATPIPAARSI